MELKLKDIMSKCRFKTQTKFNDEIVNYHKTGDLAKLVKLELSKKFASYIIDNITITEEDIPPYNNKRFSCDVIVINTSDFIDLITEMRAVNKSKPIEYMPGVVNFNI
jgi:hypothetical protein